MKFLRNRTFQIVAVTVAMLILAFLSVDRFSEVNLARNLVTVPVTAVQRVVLQVSELVSGYFVGIRDYNQLLEENRKQQREIAYLQRRVHDLAQHQTENESLREALLMKEKFADYRLIGANVLGSRSDSFTYEFRIDAGANQGVVIDDPVLTEGNHLIGRIHSVGMNSSQVITLLDEISGISGWITKEGGGHVLVRGDIRYQDMLLCLVENIPYELILSVGDIIETSGLGGIYPRGILIGEIVEIRREDNLLERYALLRPYADFNALHKVFILREMDGES